MKFSVTEGEIRLTTEVSDAASIALGYVRRDQQTAAGEPNPIFDRPTSKETLGQAGTAAVILKLGSVAAGETREESWFSQSAERALASIACTPIAREFFSREIESAWSVAFPDEPLPEPLDLTATN